VVTEFFGKMIAGVGLGMLCEFIFVKVIILFWNVFDYICE
jgi:hypothetical protein